MHSFASFLLEIIHVTHSHVPDFGLKASPNEFLIGGNAVVDCCVAPLRGVSQATHFVASCLLRIMHASHSHSFEDFLNCWPNVDVVDAVKDNDVFMDC